MNIINFNDVEIKNSFDDMNLKEELLRGIFSYGFEIPSSIQKKAIFPLIQGKDIIAQAQSGTGKTGTFTIGLLQNINIENNNTQSIILCPTRELSIQINNVIKEISKFMNVKSYACIGGTNIRLCIDEIRKGKHIIVGTPGRIHDMINRNVLKLDHLRNVIIDEADDILDRGFLNQIKDIFKYIHENVQICLFSATLPLNVFELTKQFMNNPINILIKKEELTLDGISQYFVALEYEEHKLETLRDLYESLTICQAIIYCNTIRKVQYLEQYLKNQDHQVSCIHGELSFEMRKKIMQDFQKGSSRILISTDLLARGIDIQQVSLVINYELPFQRENYIHRIGRSGRFGRKGLAINLICKNEFAKARDIEEFYQTQIKELPENLENL